MLSILSVIPIVGPIVQGVIDLFKQRADVDLQKTLDANKTALGKQTDANKTDVAVLQTRLALALATKDDLGVKLMRDLIMYPVAVWNLMYFYHLTFPNYSLAVNTPPESMQYIPYAIIAYLFVTAYRGKP
jgi:hypothetical protein